MRVAPILLFITTAGDGVPRFFTPYSNNLCRSSTADRRRPSTTPSPAGRSSAARRDL